MSVYTDSVALHRKHRGKIQITSDFPLETKEDLSLAYSPGVAQPCLDIAENPDLAYDLTWK
jgi:malate dehydrogenase (oxaloacetate-decarboxylating)